MLRQRFQILGSISVSDCAADTCEAQNEVISSGDFVLILAGRRQVSTPALSPGSGLEVKRPAKLLCKRLFSGLELARNL